MLLTKNRYKPDVRLSFLVDELGFEGYQDCAQFLVDHGGQNLIVTAEGEDSVPRFTTGKAGNLFEAARTEAFRRVDIKGQI